MTVDRKVVPVDEEYGFYVILGYEKAENVGENDIAIAFEIKGNIALIVVLHGNDAIKTYNYFINTYGVLNSNDGR